MLFWWICGGESVLPVLLLRHLGSSPWLILIDLDFVSYHHSTNHRNLDLSRPESRSPGEGNGNPLQYSPLGNPHRQRSLASYSSWGHKESDTTELLTHTHTHKVMFLILCLECWIVLPQAWTEGNKNAFIKRSLIECQLGKNRFPYGMSYNLKCLAWVEDFSRWEVVHGKLNCKQRLFSEYGPEHRSIVGLRLNCIELW